MFFKSDKDGLNGMDRVTKAAATRLSRRGFLRNIPALGVGVGLGLVCF